MANFVYFNTPVAEFQQCYNNAQRPFQGGVIHTQLPRSIAIIHTVTLAVFSVIVAAVVWSLGIVGAGLTAWKAYAQIFSKDPLIEVFYKIVGGKEKFEQIPQIELPLNANKLLWERIRGLDWNALVRPITRAKTADGRNIIIIKGLKRIDQKSPDGPKTKCVFAFVEKLHPSELPNILHPSLFTESFWAITDLSYRIAPYLNAIYPDSDGLGLESCKRIYSYISSDMANEFYAQMNEKNAL
jgi:hypothetical protein